MNLRLVLAGLLGAVLLPATAASGATPVTLSGGTASEAVVCGATVEVRTLAPRASLRAVVPAARSARGREGRRGSVVLLDKCVDGRWQRVRSIPLGARRTALRAAIGTSVPDDLRIRTRSRSRRLGVPVFARVGVGEIVDVPVTFAVRNTNRTPIGCVGAPDGALYTASGTLVGPRTALDAGAPAATLHLHGLGYSGDLFFRFDDVPGYDYGRAQAAAGHVSVVVDRIGNPATPTLADGNATCFPAQADMADQMIQRLRDGTYGVAKGAPRAFAKVGLAGHSAGGFIAQITQYAFGSADALAVVAYNDLPSPLALSTFAAANGDCTTAPRRAQGETGAPNYAAFGRTDADFAAGHFVDVEPAVAERVLARRNLDPCGDLTNALQALLGDQLLTRVGITSPVLVISGDRDALFTPPTNVVQARTAYPRSTDVELVELANTGHAVTLGRSKDAFRTAMDRWLTRQGL